jgi:acetyl-CoA acetyltransferase
MSAVHIIGVGMHPFGRFEEESYIDLGRDAAQLALQDAGIPWTEVQTAYLSRMYLPATSAARIFKQLGATGIPVCDIEAACASGGVALRHAVMGIRSGAFDVALVLGVEKMPRGFMDPSMIYEPWQIEMGMATNPSYWAMRAHRHMHEFGTTEEQIARVAWKNHKNSVHNPYAMYTREFTLEEILNSKLVCDPIRLLEICAPNDGAAAVVLASEARARTLGRGVTIAASAHTVAQYSADFRAPADSMSTKAQNPGPTEVTARAAYAEAGITAEDVDCFEVQDTDAFCEIEIYEELGLCSPGEGGAYVDSGAADIGGKTPVNMSGGLISKGEPVGASHLGQIVELVWQLRGTAGARQIEGARVGLAHVLGAGNHCAVTVVTA